MGSREYPDILQFQSRTTTTETTGQVTESFVTTLTRYGKVDQSSAGESQRNEQLQRDEDYTIRLPFDTEVAQLTPDARVVWINQLAQSVTLNITAIDTSRRGRRAELLLMAKRDK